MSKTTVIYHSNDFDGIFCREIARKFLPDAELIGWDFADKPITPPKEGTVYIMDLPCDRPFGLRYLPGTVPNDPNKRSVTNYFADKWDEFEFPVSMAKPRIMEAASRAMALKIFDEIGICPEDPKKQDPMIIGGIFVPMGTGYDRRRVSFIIAWHLNTATI